MAAARISADSADSTYVASTGQVVHCVSAPSGRTYCGTTGTRYVITGSPAPTCIEGKTWGLDDRGVWVSSGCIADFSPAPVTASSNVVTSSGELLHCVATASGRTYCGTAGTRYVIAGSPDPRCIEGQTWGLDDRGVWVSSGCVADFSPADMGATSSNYVNSSGQLVHCVSTVTGRTYCGTARTRYVIAGNPDPRCVEGQTWGVDDQGVWVTNGCVADFSPAVTTYTPSTTTYTETNARVIRCDSTGDDRTYCQSEPKRRYTLHQIREGNCVEGQTWGIDDHGLWVSGGCRGDFDEDDDND
jgi:hypothetical protein